MNRVIKEMEVLNVSEGEKGFRVEYYVKATGAEASDFIVSILLNKKDDVFGTVSEANRKQYANMSGSYIYEMVKYVFSRAWTETQTKRGRRYWYHRVLNPEFNKAMVFIKVSE